MNKRGFAIEKISSMVIILAVLIIIMSIFFTGNGSLFSKLRPLVPLPTDWITGGGKVTYTEAQMRQYSQEQFATLVNAMENMGEDEGTSCFAFLPSEKYAALFQKYALYLQYDQPLQGTRIVLEAKRVDDVDPFDNPHLIGGETSSAANFAFISGVRPCAVFGVSQAESFYTNWFGPSGTGSSDDVQQLELIELKDYKIRFSVGNDINKKDWTTRNNGDYVLYKWKRVDEDVACIAFFPVYERTSGCIVRDGQLQDDCFDPERVDNPSSPEYEGNIYDNWKVKAKLLTSEGVCGS